MPELSEDLRLLLHQLHDLSRSGTWFPRRRAVKIQALLDRLAAAREPAVLPGIARCLLDNDAGVRCSARHALTKIVTGLSFTDLLQLDDRSLWSSWYISSYISSKWDEFRLTEFSDLIGLPDEGSDTAVLGLLCFHRNGFVRQEAVRLLSERWGGSELPFLLIRLNDWVDPVAHEARQAVAARINENYAASLASSIQLILHLFVCDRRDHKELVHRILDLLLEERHAELLRDIFGGSGPGVCRPLMRYGLQKPGEHRARLVDIGLDAGDPILRRQCCSHLASIYDKDRLAEVLNRLTTDPHMPVRREALRIQAKQFPEQALKVWEQALLDPHRSIRELARWWLIRLGCPDSAAAVLYRQWLAGNPELLPALSGLAETAEECDAPRFQALLKHPFPSRRAVGIQGLSRIFQEAAVPLLLPFLRDSSPQVIREVSWALRPCLKSLDPSEFLSVTLEADGLYARRNAVALLSELGKWRSFPWLLRVIALAENETATFAERMLDLWVSPPRCNRIFRQPVGHERQDIRTALEETGNRVSDRVRALVLAELKLFDR